MNTGQPGNWYKCQNPRGCTGRYPLPDRIFGSPENENIILECNKCGYKNIFSFEVAEDKTTKQEVDHFFGIKNPNILVFWE